MHAYLQLSRVDGKKIVIVGNATSITIYLQQFQVTSHPTTAPSSFPVPNQTQFVENYNPFFQIPPSDLASMTPFRPMQWPFLSLSFLILHFVTLIAQPVSLFSISGFQTADFGSDFALLGDAKPAIGTSLVNLTTHLSPTAGALAFKRPFKLIDPDSGKPISFSTEFVFSISPGGHGEGLAFVIVPDGDLSKIFGQGTFGISKNLEKGKFVAVEFGTRNGVRGGRVGVDIGGFVPDATRDVLLLNGGEKLQSWIDYDANSKRLEIRLNKFGSERPYDPVISFSVDLLRIWGERGVLVGIGSSSHDSAPISSVYSWSFRVRTVPNGLHSMPIDPRARGRDHLHSVPKNCGLRILGAFIFATGCGTLVAFFILLLWVVFFGTSSADTIPEIPMKSLDYKYQKLDVKVDDHTSYNRSSSSLSTF